MADTILVTGDCGYEQYVFIEALPDEPASMHDTWTDAKEFEVVQALGGAGQLAACLGVDRAELCPSAEPVGHFLPDSIYLLTKQDRLALADEDKEHEAEARKRRQSDPDASLDLPAPALAGGSSPGDADQVWKIGRAIVAREGTGCACGGDLCGAAIELGRMVAVLDFRQGWLKRNHAQLESLLANRPFVVRTHDPCFGPDGDGAPLRRVWQAVRESRVAVGNPPGIWFCPLQDMAGGSLRVAGAWHTRREQVVSYLKKDTTLYDEAGECWRDAVVVQIDNDGALVAGPGKGETLLAFPGDQPGSFKQRNPGDVVGSGIVLAAVLCDAYRLDLGIDHQKLVQWTAEGLRAVRRLLRRGYPDPGPHTSLGLPAKQRALVPLDHVREPRDAASALPVEYTSQGSAVADALHVLEVPKGQFARFLAYRLGELETCSEEFAQELIVTRARIDEHVTRGKGVLSFGLFGGPGSGKSFLIEQIQKSIGGKLEELAFNVSQFTSPDHLRDKLVEVQSLCLQGHIPFVQWDEFDCMWDGRQGGWLSRFLMPMQDAAFWDGNTRRELGQCVFAFIGGTWRDRAEFQEWCAKKENAQYKAPDFHSRLDRVLDVPPVDGDPTGGAHLLNRALTLRRDLKKVKRVHRGVIEMLLTAPLRHGMRSLKAIVTASSLSKTKEFLPIHLPPHSVLDHHLGDTQAALLVVAARQDDDLVGLRGE